MTTITYREHGSLQTRILEWVVLFSRGSLRPRTRTQVSCMEGCCFTSWAVFQGGLRPSTDFYKYYILGWEGGEVNEHTYLHKFTTSLPKFMNKENEPIWIMQPWKLTTTKSSSNNCQLLLSRFSRVWLCATAQTAAHQAPPSLGFSRQEHWSGVPFPSPVNESEKWTWSRSVVSDS